MNGQIIYVGFMACLLYTSESERKDLLSFAIGWAVQNRKRTGMPVCEYFLVHIMEFISPEDEKAYRNMDKVMTFISVSYTHLERC